MGRKSKLSEAQWSEIEKRLLEGESRRALAREFGISESSLREKKSAQVAEIKNVANQIVATNRALQALPISAQQTAQSLAVRLTALSDNLMSAAHYGAATAHRLAGIAHGKAAEIDDSAPLDGESLEALRGIAALTKTANDAAASGLNLLSANKEMAKRAETAAVPDGLGHFYGEDEAHA